MEVFVARQPLFNRNGEEVAYELLYRRNHVNTFPLIDGDKATADVIINSFIHIGIGELSNGLPCFINFTENLLDLGLPTYFNPREIVIEILETVNPSRKLIDICKELKSFGYQISIDDLILNKQNPYLYELAKYADLIKVDFLSTTLEKRERIENFSSQYGLKMIAEKIETHADFMDAKRKGYEYFQGYFFSKPVIISSYDIPSYLQFNQDIIENLFLDEPSIDSICEWIEQDLSLSYKLLKLINSPQIRPKNKVNSIKQAIMLIGLIEIQKWIYVLTIRDSGDKEDYLSQEMMKLSLTRAKTCESISKQMYSTHRSSSYFMTGMFSLIDQIMKLPMEYVIRDLPLNEDIFNALMGKENQLKCVLDLVIAAERAEWTMISQKCNEIGIPEIEFFKIYAESINWTKDVIENQQERINARTTT